MGCGKPRSSCVVMSFHEFFRTGRRFPAWEGRVPPLSSPAVGIALIHVAALAIMATTEVGTAPKLVFVLSWGFLNFFWLALLRRPGLAAALSLIMIVALVLLSSFKHEILLMTVNFVDLMIIDPDTIAFFLTIFPHLGRNLLIAAAVILPLLVWLWRVDSYRVRMPVAAMGGGACLVGLVGLAAVDPMQQYEAFYSDDYVSKFVRSGVDAVSELMEHGFLESDASASDHLKSITGTGCQTTATRPHIIMILDESSFDISAVPGIKVPRGYRRHFRSFDGKQREFVVEGNGGPTWYTEYNVLTGLSSRSFGRFSYFVTRIAAGRVERGLPNSLRRCGYKTFTLYPAAGAFLSARSFQSTTGIEHFLDAKAMGAHGIEPDDFYFDQARRVIARERGDAPLFLFVYVAANHFPWNFRYRWELTPDWKGFGNSAKVDEYLRRQTMSADDYAGFLARLKSEFPHESFLLVRFGDHQPEFAERIIDPAVDRATLARRIEAFDPRYFTTYYAIDTINFKPVDLSSARDRLEAAYLPLVVQEAAGLPLDPSFVEQKKILQRCKGAFYLCNSGAEARRFNRLLIDAGLIKGL